VLLKNAPGAHTHRRFWKISSESHGAIVTLMLTVMPATPNKGTDGEATLRYSAAVDPTGPDTTSVLKAADWEKYKAFVLPEMVGAMLDNVSPQVKQLTSAVRSGQNATLCEYRSTMCSVRFMAAPLFKVSEAPESGSEMP
jgi:hypothetical protein